MSSHRKKTKSNAIDISEESLVEKKQAKKTIDRNGFNSGGNKYWH